MTKCHHCKATATERLLLGCTDGEIAEVFFCKPHMLAFVKEQERKGNVRAPLRKVEDSSDSGCATTATNAGSKADR